AGGSRPPGPPRHPRRRAGRTTRSATAAPTCGCRRSPGAGGAARARGCPPSTAPPRAPTTPGTRPARPARRGRTPQRPSGPTQLLGDLLQHPTVDGVGVFLPAEHAHRGDPVERPLAKRREELVPVDVAVADLVVLVDPRVDPGRVDDVPVADVGPVVEAVVHVQVLQLAARVLDHPPHVA